MTSGFRSRIDKKEMAKYYHSITDDELYSQTKFVFDLWPTLNGIVKQFGKKKLRIIDVGGGKGDIIIAGSKYGYEVFLTDIYEDFLKEAVKRYPELSNRVALLDIFNTKNVIEFINRYGYFDVVLCLGFVLNHTDSLDAFRRGFANLIKLANENSVIVVDIMLSDMYPGRPMRIWSDFNHTLISLKDLADMSEKYGLILAEFHSIRYDYSDAKNYNYREYGSRFFIIKPY